MKIEKTEFIILLFSLVLLLCSDPVTECDTDIARAQWEKVSTGTYTYVFRFNCHCIVDYTGSLGGGDRPVHQAWSRCDAKQYSHRHVANAATSASVEPLYAIQNFFLTETFDFRIKDLFFERSLLWLTRRN
jgi:hypothetical protein